MERIRRYLVTKTFVSEVIVVDDGSNDGTDAVLSRVAADWPELRILRNERNRGKGYSVRRGVLAAKGELVLFSDADLSAPIGQADDMVVTMQSTGADVVVGSRAMQRTLIGVRQPLFRECAGMCFNVLVRLLTGLQIRDTQCGMKLFRRRTTRSAFECQTVEGFGFDPELLFLIKQGGGNIVEVPVRWNNDPASKVRFLRDSTTMLLELISLRWKVLTGRLALPLRADR
jgi:dolichyl-phosphate beta-glucosyltransferase